MQTVEEEEKNARECHDDLRGGRLKFFEGNRNLKFAKALVDFLALEDRKGPRAHLSVTLLERY